MSITREFATAGAISGRIYVVGGYLPINDFWAEEFEPEKKRCRRVPSLLEIREKWMHGSAVIDGKLLAMADRDSVVFDPAVVDAEAEVAQEKAWGMVPTSLDLVWRGRAAAVGEVLYFYSSSGRIKGYDLTKNEWRIVEGVDKELPKFLYGTTLAYVGKLLCLFWKGSGKVRSKEMEINCAGIRVTVTNSSGLQGSIEWFETFGFGIPKKSVIAHCISMEF